MGKKEVSRTLNSLDCIARGCALYASMLKPSFQTPYEIEEFNPHSVQISYKFVGKEKVITKEIFSIGATFPATKSITFENCLGGADVLIHYDDKSTKLLPGLPTQISQYTINEGIIDQTKHVVKYRFIMKISNNIHNIAVLDGSDFE